MLDKEKCHPNDREETMTKKTKEVEGTEAHVEKESLKKNFELTMLYERLSGRRHGPVRHLMLAGWADSAHLFFTPDTQCLLLKQKIGAEAKKKDVTSTTKNTCSYKDCSTPAHSLSKFVYCYKHMDPNDKPKCKGCGKSGVRKGGLCHKCGSSDTPRHMCILCELVQVPRKNGACGRCENDTRCVKCKKRAYQFAGRVCRGCSGEWTEEKCVLCNKNKKRNRSGLCRGCSKLFSNPDV